MKKILLVLLGIAFLSVGALSAETIGENFEAAGLQIYGGGSYYNNLDSYSSYSIGAGANFYVFDNLGFGAGVNYSGNTTGDSDLRISGNVNYAIVPNPGAPQGLAFQGGLSLSYNMDLEASSNYLSLYPWLRANFFVKPRIAPYIYVEGVSFRFDDNEFTDVVNTYVYVGFGLSFFHARKDIVLIK